MHKVIGATLIAASALAATVALAEGENVAQQQRAKLEALWGRHTVPASTGQVSATRADTATRNYSGLTEGTRGKTHTTGLWAGNYRGGKVYEPAGR